MVLSLLAPLLAERGERQRIDVHRWDHYLGKLRDRKYTQLRCHGSYNYETVNEAIAISFDHLDKETRHSLNDFVIFLDATIPFLRPLSPDLTCLPIPS